MGVIGYRRLIVHYFAVVILFVGGKVGAHTRDTKTDRETS
jgi:hypothetical protein